MEFVIFSKMCLRKIAACAVKRKLVKIYISVKLFMNISSTLHRNNFYEINILHLKVIISTKILTRKIHKKEKIALAKALVIATAEVNYTGCDN